MDNKERIKELVAILNYHRDLYYNGNNSEISDYEYDKLYDELNCLEQQEEYILSNSPTVTVGYEVKSKLQKVKHSHPMLSLDKTKDVNELAKFINGQDYVLSLKMDGLTCLLTYDNGELVRAETRGDGEYGEDITHNARMFENIPLTIPNKNRIEFEGEAIITYDDFEKINKKLPENEKYKNPRNLASGSVRQLDNSITKNRHVKFIVWKVPKGFMKVIDGLNFAQDMGFDIVPYCCTNDVEHIDFLIDDRKEIAKKNSYPIDGLVCTYNNVEYGKSLGMTGHHPKHSIAFKFYDDVYETTLKDIEWSLGKTGQITPVAIFEPVEIDGTEVEKASLHNISIMQELWDRDWHSGLTVTVYKANQIIPQISKVEHKINSCAKRLMIPQKCPVCGYETKVQQDNNSKVLICNNPNCKGKLLGKLTHFVSKNAMNIDGLSEATLQFLIDRRWVNSFEDLYKLDYYRESWKDYDGFGDKSVDKILDSIEKSRTTTLDRVINAVSIPNIGKQTAKDIAKYCDYDIETFKKYMQDCRVFNNIDGIGYKIIDSLKEWLDTEWIDFLELCRHLYFANPNLDNKSSVNLSNKTFVITGKLNIFSNRDEAVEMIQSLRGKVSGSVSKNTTFLVNNDINSTSSKNKKARELGIPIISEEELVSMCKLNM